MNPLDPRIWLVAIALMVASSLAGFFYGQHTESNKNKLKEQAIELAADKVLSEAKAKSLADERSLRAEFQAIDSQREKEVTNAKAQIDSLRAKLRSGSVRLSVATSSCHTDTSPGGATTGVVETRADLLPDVSESILTIGSDADNTVRELNSCIDKYEAVRLKMSEYSNPAETEK